MNDETLKTLVKVEQDYIDNADSLDALLDTDDRQKTILAIEKAQRLEHDERKLRLEEARLKFETEKNEYQKKQNMTANLIQIGLGVLAAAGAILGGVAKCIQVHNQRAYVREAYAIDQVTTLTSKTARDLLSSGANPKI